MKLMFIAAIAATIGCAAASVPPARRPPATSSRFDFHSGAWINLHHLLWGQAIQRLKAGAHRELADDPADLDEASARTWRAAVDFYAASYAERDFTFDDAMADLNHRLSGLDDRADIRASQLPPDLVAILAQVMPIYRARLWPADDRRNRAWIDQVAVLVAHDAADLSRELAGAYHSAWPSQPLRVDVTRYAGWAGAYTTLEPDHLTISSADPGNQGPSALECVLHEASHAIIRPLRDALDNELHAQGKSSDDLWHAVLFYSTGYVVQRRLGHDYVPYAYKHGLYTRGTWPAYIAALETQWTPYLDGKKSFDAAVHDLVGAIPAG
jgi:hypothetical protein